MNLNGKKKSRQIAEHYNEFSDSYLKHYGNVIQAHRTTNIDSLLDYLADKMQLSNGMNVLDMGCGYCGPAIYYAKKFDVHFTCITNSVVQFETAKKLIQEDGLDHKIMIICRDYHNINDLKSEEFDLAFFLESFGHSYHPKSLIKSVHRILKPGGALFIKDYFAVNYKDSEDEETRQAIKKSLENIYKYYKYRAIDKPRLMKDLSETGFIICSDTPPGYDLDNTKVVSGFEIELGIKIFERDDFKPLNVHAYEVLCKK